MSDDHIQNHTVTYFPTDIREAWMNVERYQRENQEHKSWLSALNLQVARRHWTSVKSRWPRLATDKGEHVVSTQSSAPTEFDEFDCAFSA